VKGVYRKKVGSGVLEKGASGGQDGLNDRGRCVLVCLALFVYKREAPGC